MRIHATLAAILGLALGGMGGSHAQHSYPVKPMGGGTQAYVREVPTQDIEKWKKVVKAADIRL